MAFLRSLLRIVFSPGEEDRDALPRLDVVVFAAAVVCGAMLVVLDLYQRLFSYDGVELFNVDGKANLATWFHSLVLSGAALAALAIAFTVFDRRRRMLWLALGSGLAFFSLDKSVSLHERVGSRLEVALDLPQDGGRLAWLAAWSPLMLVMVIALVLCVWGSNRRTQLWVLGLFIGAAGKVALEAGTFFAVHLFDATEEYGWFYGLEVIIEESVQLLGFACLFAGFAQLLADRLWAMARGELSELDQAHQRDGVALPAQISRMLRLSDGTPRPVVHGQGASAQR
jgi:hypothetical protein